MYFRCVFTLLLCCVLVGLDWAEPMMYLYLHVTFSCIRTFKFLYLLYCILFGAFLIVSLSLSPSFFVSYVSCNMAPKCKSTPSRNPLRSGASSFSSLSDPTHSHVWFRDKKAKSDFLENFLRRDIHSKH